MDEVQQDSGSADLIKIVICLQIFRKELQKLALGECKLLHFIF